MSMRMVQGEIIEEDKKREDDDLDDIFADVGIMMEGSHASTLKHFEWPLSPSTHADSPSRGKPKKPIHVAIHVVDDEPGAIQSGHYLWPASPALCDFVISHFQQQQKYHRPKSILELGAGCGLVSLVALQLFASTCQCLVVTDHDPGTLQRARDNHETTLEELYERAETEEEQYDCINRLGSIPVHFLNLVWGKPVSLIEETVNEHDEEAFDLILGSDLIYDTGVVRPLLETAGQLLSTTRPDAKFLLSQSFVYDDGTETEIDTVAAQLQLERVIHKDTLAEQGGIRIQEFRRKPIEQDEETKQEEDSK